MFPLAAAALAASGAFALLAALAPVPAYAPPQLHAGPPPRLCTDADISAPESLPDGYVWRVKPETRFGYPLPDFVYVLPLGDFILKDGTPVKGEKIYQTHDIIADQGGFIQTMQVGLLGGWEVLTRTDRTLLRIESRSDGAVIYWNAVEKYECDSWGGICTGREAYVEFPDGRLVIVAVSAFPTVSDYARGIELPGLTADEVTDIVGSVARLIRFGD